ncbi:MAG: hypothetical protein J7K23_04215 [Thermoproteales archaeon]|nr:hypothetical protein [Thermoproteales archaeon]
MKKLFLFSLLLIIFITVNVLGEPTVIEKTASPDIIIHSGDYGLPSLSVNGNVLLRYQDDYESSTWASTSFSKDTSSGGSAEWGYDNSYKYHNSYSLYVKLTMGSTLNDNDYAELTLSYSLDYNVTDITFYIYTRTDGSGQVDNYRVYVNDTQVYQSYDPTNSWTQIDVHLGNSNSFTIKLRLDNKIGSSSLAGMSTWMYIDYMFSNTFTLDVDVPVYVTLTENTTYYKLNYTCPSNTYRMGYNWPVPDSWTYINMSYTSTYLEKWYKSTDNLDVDYGVDYDSSLVSPPIIANNSLLYVKATGYDYYLLNYYNSEPYFEEVTKNSIDSFLPSVLINDAEYSNKTYLVLNDEKYTILPPYAIFQYGNYIVDKVNKYVQWEFTIENDAVEHNSVVIWDDDDSVITLTKGGTGSLDFTLSKVTSPVYHGSYAIKVSITSGSCKWVKVKRVYSTNQDWSSKDFLVINWYGQNTGRKISIFLSAPNWDNRQEWYFYDNFSGWKQLVFPLRKGDYEVGTPDLSNIAEVGIIISEADGWSDGDSIINDWFRVDVGQWVKYEVMVPDSMNILELKSWDGSVFKCFFGRNLLDNSWICGAWGSKLYFLDGTTAYDIWGDDSAPWKALAVWNIDEQGETPSLNVGNSGLISPITYSSRYGTKYRVGFAVKMPPYSDYTNINKARLRIRIYYEDEQVTYSGSEAGPIAPVPPNDAVLWPVIIKIDEDKATMTKKQVYSVHDLTYTLMNIYNDYNLHQIDFEYNLSIVYENGTINNYGLSSSQIVVVEDFNYLIFSTVYFENYILRTGSYMDIGLSPPDRALLYTITVKDYTGDFENSTLILKNSKGYYLYYFNTTGLSGVYLTYGKIYTISIKNNVEERGLGYLLADTDYDKTFIIGIRPKTPEMFRDKISYGITLNSSGLIATVSSLDNVSFTKVNLLIYNETNDLIVNDTSYNILSYSYTYMGADPEGTYIVNIKVLREDVNGTIAKSFGVPSPPQNESSNIPGVIGRTVELPEDLKGIGWGNIISIFIAMVIFLTLAIPRFLEMGFIASGISLIYTWIIGWNTVINPTISSGLIVVGLLVAMAKNRGS